MPDFRWNPDLRISDFLTLFGFALTVASLFFAGIGLRRTARVQRAQFLLNITDRYFTDTDVRRFFYRLNYERFQFDRQTFFESEDERHLDTLLYRFDLIGRMLEIGVVSVKEVEIMAFQASRVFDNAEVKKYLDFLDEDYRRLVDRRAHEDARFLASRILKGTENSS